MLIAEKSKLKENYRIQNVGSGRYLDGRGEGNSKPFLSPTRGGDPSRDYYLYWMLDIVGAPAAKSDDDDDGGYDEEYDDDGYGGGDDIPRRAATGYESDDGGGGRAAMGFESETLEVIVCGPFGHNLQVNPNGLVGSHVNKGGWETFTLTTALDGVYIQSKICGDKYFCCDQGRGLFMADNKGDSSLWQVVKSDRGDGAVHLYSPSKGENLQFNPEGAVGTHVNKGGWETVKLERKAAPGTFFSPEDATEDCDY